MASEPGLDTERLRSGYTPSRRALVRTVVHLSLPVVLAELCSTAMQYIDTAMVGSLGASATAAIGIVESTMWLIGGLCMAAATGFSVQVAQLIGAGRAQEARHVLRQSLVVLMGFGVLLGIAGASISGYLPQWLGAEPNVIEGARTYFLIFSCGIPATQAIRLCVNMLQCSGDMRTPSLLNMAMCLLDVVFNLLLIFPTRTISWAGISFTLPGAGLGVAGAALGTVLAELAVAVLMLWATCIRSPLLRLERHSGSWKPTRHCLVTALRISAPVALERALTNGAQIASTAIVAPLGTVAVAANSLAVTAESICYMPGFGIGAAATTLVGQTIGAGRPDLARRFARLSVGLGMVVMGIAGVLLLLLAPALIALFTPDPAVRELGAFVLRIEALAEPLFAASIVCSGALRGAGDTLIPSIIDLSTMWGIRITLAAYLAPRVGLMGVWIAMALELSVRGSLFLVRLLRERWLRKGSVTASPTPSAPADTP